MELISKMYNKNLMIKEFLENEIVLNCKTIEDAEDLFSYINNLSEQRKKDFIDYWYEHRKETCYECCDDKNYYFSSLRYYQEQEHKEIKEWKWK